MATPPMTTGPRPSAPTTTARTTALLGTDVVRHTARAVDVSALLFVSAAAALTVVAVGAIDTAAVGPTARVCGGALAASATVALRDQGGDLLAATPTSPRVRLLQRSALIIPATLLAATLVDALARRSVDGPLVAVSGIESVLALVCVGFAATTCCGRRWPDVASSTGAAVVLGWSTASAFLPDSGAWWSSLWSTHPWAVVVAAAAITWIASAERR